MKSSFLLSATAVLVLFAFSGCEDILDKVGVTINSDYTNIDFTTNPDKAGTFSETIEVVHSNLDSLIDAEGQDAGEVNAVKIKDAMAQVMDGGNLDPFESFWISIETDDLAAVTIAEVTTLPDGFTEISLTKKETDLSEYLKSDQYTIKVKTVLDQDLDTQRYLRVRVRFEIKVGL